MVLLPGRWAWAVSESNRTSQQKPAGRRPLRGSCFLLLPWCPWWWTGSRASPFSPTMVFGECFITAAETKAEQVPSSCFHLPSAGITGVPHLVWVLGTEPRAPSMRGRLCSPSFPRLQCVLGCSVSVSVSDRGCCPLPATLFQPLWTRR